MPVSPNIIGVAWWVFDICIFGGLIGIGVVCAELCARGHARRWTWLRSTSVLMLAAVWLVVFYGSFIEPKWLTVHEETIELATDAPVRGRVAVLSDIHVGPYKKEAWVRKVVERLNQTDVDMVLIAGDHVFSRTEQMEMLAPLADLRWPTYVVMGNHDQEYADVDAIATQLEAWGIQVLRNQSTVVTFPDGGQVNLAGVDDVWFSFDPVQALQDIQEDLPTILITHNPDYILDPTSEHADLVVAGHTHCGQIRLPWIGAVPPLPTTLGRAWDCGLFSYTGGQLWITPGVGETGPRARLFNPPQIDVLTLTF